MGSAVTARTTENNRVRVDKRQGRAASGLSFVEILTGIVVFAVMVVPIYWVMSSARTDTASAVNYLRALELAQETLEWVQQIPLDAKFRRTAESLSGSLVQEGTGRDFAPVPLGAAVNDQYSAALMTQAAYPAQYCPAFFHRSVEVADIDAGVPYQAGLKRVTVTIRWNEGKVPDRLEPLAAQADAARQKKVSLALLLADRNPLF